VKISFSPEKNQYMKNRIAMQIPESFYAKNNTLF